MKDIDARKALDIVVNKLISTEGYYIWTALGEPPVWLLRVPRENKGDDNWDKREVADMIHLCRPTKFIEAMECNDRKNLSVFAGYVVDSKCVRCKHPIPKDVESRMEIQIKLSKLRKKTM